jgi:predicted CXXCH cytochrome family protein
LRSNSLTRRLLLPAAIALFLAIGTIVHRVDAQGQSPTKLAMVMPSDRRPAAPDGLATSWTDPMCGHCHQVDSLFSHPVAITPSRSIPPYMPLTDGQVTCITCHEDSAQAHTLARQAHSSMLRQSPLSEDFCVQCHDPADRSRTSQHALGIARAHLAWPDAPQDDPIDPATGLDATNRNCLTCHDGLTAPGDALRIAGPFASDALPDHPVGIRYAVLEAGAGVTRAAIKLHSPATLDARVRLVDGRIGCTTCHSPFSSEPKLLVMGNRGSRLCLTCHNER